MTINKQLEQVSSLLSSVAEADGMINHLMKTVFETGDDKKIQAAKKLFQEHYGFEYSIN